MQRKLYFILWLELLTQRYFEWMDGNVTVKDLPSRYLKHSSWRMDCDCPREHVLLTTQEVLIPAVIYELSLKYKPKVSKHD